MSAPLTTAMNAKAQEMAANLAFSPEGRLRLAHSEKTWRYRSYQGGEPSKLIDWKQSARSRDILVREHEPIETRTIFMGLAPSPHRTEEENDKLHLLLLALANALVRKERAIGFLCDNKPTTTTLSKVFGLMNDSLGRQALDSVTIKKQFILLATSHDKESQNALLPFLQKAGHHGNHGAILLAHDAHHSVAPHEATQLEKTAGNLGWPILHYDFKARPDMALSELFAACIKGSL